MTDEQDDHDADGFVVIHHPADGGEWYGIGPFPPIDDLWDMIVKESACDCRIERLWVRFPKGIVMAVAPPPEVAEAVKALVQSVLDEVEGEPNDRLN